MNGMGGYAGYASQGAQPPYAQAQRLGQAPTYTNGNGNGAPNGYGYAPAPSLPPTQQVPPPMPSEQERVAAAGAQRMALTTVLAAHPGYARGQKLNLLEYVYAQPSKAGGSKKRKVLGLDVKFRTVPVSLEEATQRDEPAIERVAAWAGDADSLSSTGWLAKQLAMAPQLAERLQKASHENEQDQSVHQPSRQRTMNILANWESNVILDDPPPRPKRAGDGVARYAKVNPHLESDDWLESIWQTGSRQAPPAQSPAPLASTSDAIVPMRVPDAVRPDPKALDYLNLSLDHIYTRTREIKQKIRQSIDVLDIVHALPATRIQMPYYPVALSKAQQRTWHRPRMQFERGEEVRFDALKKKMESKQERAKRNMAGRAASNEVLKAKDLTMAEKGKYTLLEFSEQHPPIMSGFGMGSNLITYYRKVNESDEYTRAEKDNLGELVVLDPHEQEPIPLFFMEGGKPQQTLVNNLIRAPLYEHTPAHTDFLVIRSTVDGESSYHIREIPHLFVVGQTLPHRAAVPGVKSKDMGAYKKERLLYMMQTALRMNGGTLETNQITRYYPDRDASKLKEYLTSDGGDLWRPRTQADATNPNYKVYADAVARLQPTPEHACLLEAHDVARRLLSDAGYYVPETAKEDKEEDADEGDEDGQLEMQLAAWKITRNYIKDPMNLRLESKGNPTGREFEGFDLRRAPGTVKGTKKRAEDVEDYLWRAKITFANQRAALEATTSPTAQADAPSRSLAANRAADDEDRKPVVDDDDDEDAEGEEEDDDDDDEATPSLYGRETPRHHGNHETDDVLCITREMPDGSTQVEYVRGSRIINAYLLEKKRQMVNNLDVRDMMAVDAVFNDESMDQEIKNMLAQRLGRTLQKTKANLDRRQKASGVQPKKQRRQARCKRCGTVGHTSAQKRLCPANPADWPINNAGYVPTKPPRPTPGEPAKPRGLKLKLGKAAPRPPSSE